jgi:hypothetical protein
VVVLTPEGGKCISVRACKGNKNTIVSRKTALLFGSDRTRLAWPMEVVGPSGIPIRVEETRAMTFPPRGPHEGELEISTLVVDTLELYCGFPQNSMWKWEMQLG